MTKCKESSTCVVKCRMPDDQTRCQVSQMLSCWLSVMWQDLRAAVFWDFTQRRVVIPFRRFGTNYRSQIQGSSSPSWDRKIPEERNLIYIAEEPDITLGERFARESISSAVCYDCQVVYREFSLNSFLLSTMITRGYYFVWKIAFYWKTVKNI
jgi:hypothetical protein